MKLPKKHITRLNALLNSLKVWDELYIQDLNNGNMSEMEISKKAFDDARATLKNEYGLSFGREE
jgi:hypothetical protein